MTKKDEVKVLAFKEQLLPEGGKAPKSDIITKDKYKDTTPGNNTPEEVRAAQLNILSVGIERGMVSLKYPEDCHQDVKDLLQMITPNAAYVTGPPRSFSARMTQYD